MGRSLLLAGFAAAAVSLGACGGSEENGGVTAEESQQLNEAAEMLDASPDSLVASEEAPLGNGEAAIPAGNEEAGDVASGNGSANAQ